MNDMQNVMDTSPFFIVGVPRSGTTLLRRLLNKHSNLCVPNETHFIPHLYRPFISKWQQGKHREAIDLLNQQPLVRQWGVNIGFDEIQLDEAHDAYANAVNIIMNQRAQQDNKQRWGEKTPVYVFHIPLLLSLFPNGRFIHIYRDGRDVALSLMPLAWGPNNSYACARYWRQMLQEWNKHKEVMGEKWLEVKYEALIEAPEQQLNQICDFIHVPFDTVMLDKYPIVKNRTERWRNKFNMSHRELVAFESQAGDTLTQWGYTCAIEMPSIPLHYQIFAQIDNLYRRISNRVLRVD